LQRVLKDAKVGSTVMLDAGYASTSLSENIAKQFLRTLESLIVEIQVPKGAKAFSLGKASQMTFELEVLINRGARYIVKEYDLANKRVVLELL